MKEVTILDSLTYFKNTDLIINKGIEANCLLVAVFDNGNLKYDSYFNQLLKIIQEEGLPTDLLIIQNSGIADMAVPPAISCLPKYEKIIFSGKAGLSVWFKEDLLAMESYLTAGLEINEDYFLFTKYKEYRPKVYLVDSHKAAFYKNQIMKFTSQLKSSMGIEETAGTSLSSEKILHISEMPEVLKMIDGKKIGFDYETNDLSTSSYLRLTGIGLSTATEGYFFYFSIDRDEYNKEFASIKDIFVDFCKRNYKNMITYNVKFESLVTERLFGTLFEFQDALPLCHASQSPGSLKKNAVAFLGIPLWNEQTGDIIKEYEEVNDLLTDQDREIIREKGLSQETLSLTSLTAKEKMKYCAVDLVEETKELVIKNITLQDGKISFSYTVGKRGRNRVVVTTTYNEASSIKDMFVSAFKEHNDLQEVHATYYDEPLMTDYFSPDGVCISIKLTSVDYGKVHFLEKKYGTKELEKFFVNNYSGWEICDREILGKYCILDSFYTLLLFNKLYPTFEKSYPVYRAQMFISGLMEKFGLAVNRQQFYEFKSVYEQAGLEAFREMLSNPQVFKNIVDRAYGKMIEQQMKDSIKELLEEKATGFKITKALAQDILSDTPMEDKHKSLLFSFYSNLNPVYFENPEMFNMSLPQHIKELRDEARALATKQCPSYDEVSERISRELKEISYFEDFKEYCNINSNTTENTSLVWSAIVTNEVESIFPLFKIAEKVDYYLTLLRISPEGSFKDIDKLKELLLKIKESSRMEKLEHVTELYKIASKGEFDTPIFAISTNFKKVYREGLARAKSLKLDGRNAEDMNEMLSLLDMFLLPEEKTLDDVQDYPDNFKILFNFLMLKKIFKAHGTYILGSQGAANMYEVDTSTYARMKNFVPHKGDTSDKTLILNTDFFANNKDTLRWASGVHTIPKLLECTGAIAVRDPDNVLINFDAAQSEVRVVATVANDTGMLESLKRGEDIHRANAARLFKKAPEDVTKLERDAAKSSITFGLLYGKSVENLANDNFFGDVEYAKSVNEALFREMPDIKKWMDAKHKEVCERNGKVKVDLFDHDLFVGVPSEYSSEHLRRSINYPIQSLSSSLNGYFGYRVYKEALNQGIINYPLSFVHDAWMFEIPMKCVFQFLEIVKYYFKTFPYEQIGLPADCDFDISINKFMPKEIKYEIKDGKVFFETEIILIHNNIELYHSFLRNLPECVITSEERVKKIMDSQHYSDLRNSKCSWGPNMQKEVEILKLKGECRYDAIPFSEGYDASIFSDLPMIKEEK